MSVAAAIAARMATPVAGLRIADSPPRAYAAPSASADSGAQEREQASLDEKL